MDGFDDGAPALSSDGNTLYFYSNRPGGSGVYDLWMSARQGGGQAAPAPPRRPRGVDPGIVQVLASFPGPDDRPVSDNLQVFTAGQANRVSPQPARESQARALAAAASSLLPASARRQATDRFFAARPSANPKGEPLGWRTTLELNRLALSLPSES